METVSTLPIATKTIAGALSTSKQTVGGIASKLHLMETQIALLNRLPTTPSHALIIMVADYKVI